MAGGTFVVHTESANPFTLAQVLRQTVARQHAGLRVSNIRTQADLVRAQTVRERLLASLAVFFAGVALLLAGVGLYGILTYSVLQRRREIGIRIAVGAGRRGIVRLVTVEIAVTVLVGSAVGLTLGLASARYVESLFYQVRAADTAMLSLPAFAILCTATLSAIPAVMRALRTDPAEILRSE